MPDEPTPLYHVHAETQPEPKHGSTIGHIFKYIGILTTVVLVSITSLYWYLTYLNQPPDAFPVNEIVTIEAGTSVRDITNILGEAGIVRSDILLYYIIVLFYDAPSIKASTYTFNNPLTSFEVATLLTKGDFTTDLIRFTHIEGERATRLASRAAVELPGFRVERFVQNTEQYEGKLWPDTYFIPKNFTDEDLLLLLLTTFEEQMTPLNPEIETHPLTLDEILVLASIIEREANSPESKRLVSGVLQNRLEIGMALQADASIEYVLEKPLSELTPDDLKIDSPYNTYLYPGLPPTPIGNPGMEAIMAVLEPTASNYFYYITDNNGIFHFAETYDGHLRNIERYLR
jgi:UPF0755 protein